MMDRVGVGGGQDGLLVHTIILIIFLLWKLLYVLCSVRSTPTVGGTDLSKIKKEVSNSGNLLLSGLRDYCRNKSEFYSKLIEDGIIIAPILTPPIPASLRPSKVKKNAIVFFIR